MWGQKDHLELQLGLDLASGHYLFNHQLDVPIIDAFKNDNFNKIDKVLMKFYHLCPKSLKQTKTHSRSLGKVGTKAIKKSQYLMDWPQVNLNENNARKLWSIHYTCWITFSDWLSGSYLHNRKDVSLQFF